MMMEEGEILDFCKKWLSAWTGNKPENLIDYYSNDSYYQDPANPEGLKRHEQILPYFKKLLAANPNWIWEADEVFPTEKGFILKWKATIPFGSKTSKEYGRDIVELEKGKITRNEVYFDRSELLSQMKLQKRT